MSTFTVRSASSGLVSLLNPVDIDPLACRHHDPSISHETSLETPAPQKRHVCSECARGFSSTGHLNRHHTTHTGEKEHVCPFPGCSKSASRRDNLVQHYRMHLPRGEHDRCTSHIRQKMDQKMVDVGVTSPRKPRGRKANQSTAPVFAYYPPSHPDRRDSLSSDSSMSDSPDPTVFARPMTTSSVSSSPALLTPALPLSSASSEQSHYFAPHLVPPRKSDGSSYQSLSFVVEYSRNFRVSNARAE